MKKKLLILLTITLCICLSFETRNEVLMPSTINYEFSISLLKSELKKNNVKNINIVLAQAKLETGHFTSKAFKKYHNLFGLSKKKKGSENEYELIQFNHWKESVKFYKRFQEKNYKGGNYYVFLRKIGYAEDSTYIDKLKVIK